MADAAPPTFSARQVNSVVWHIGRRPTPWEWVDWKYATDGRFDGRWDDVDGEFRTLYVAASAFACFVEVLAHFRTDQGIADDIGAIESEDDDVFPTAAPGGVGRGWINERRLGTAMMSGRFCDVTHSQTVAVLRRRVTVHPVAGADFDASALKDAGNRDLTRTVARLLYEAADDTGDPSFEGVAFRSRHGDELALWAVFERPGDGPVSPTLSSLEDEAVDRDAESVARAFALHGLHWVD